MVNDHQTVHFCNRLISKSSQYLISLYIFNTLSDSQEMRRKNIIKLRDIVLVYQVIGILFLIKLFNNTMSSICCGSTFFLI